MADHVHSDSCIPETCFRAKMRFIRENGGLAVKTPVMRDGVSWYDTTYAEQARIMKGEAAAKGLGVHQKHPVYDK